MREKKALRAEILKKAFERAQKQNRAFSLRALAQKLKLSPGFVSKILSGKTDLPFDRVNDFSLHLKLDQVSENRLVKSYADTKVERIGGLTKANAHHDDVMKNYVELAENQFFLLSKWYFIAILDLAGCKDFDGEAAWVSKKLRIPASEADQALKLLKAQKILVQNSEGEWVKVAKNIRFPTKQSRDLIRGYHQMLMKKAMDTLQNQTQQSDFDRRLVTGISMAANPAHLKKAMARLNEAMYEIAALLSEGECTEVYHFGLQLFPVSNP